jgi:predicted transcriptional regulator
MKRTSYFGHPGKMSLHYELFERAEHIMSRNPIVCITDDKVKDALNKMTTHNVRNLPVVENDEIVGEITIRHLIRKFYGIINSLEISSKQ